MHVSISAFRLLLICFSSSLFFLPRTDFSSLVSCFSSCFFSFLFRYKQRLSETVRRLLCDYIAEDDEEAERILSRRYKEDDEDGEREEERDKHRRNRDDGGRKRKRMKRRREDDGEDDDDDYEDDEEREEAEIRRSELTKRIREKGKDGEVRRHGGRKRREIARDRDRNRDPKHKSKASQSSIRRVNTQQQYRPQSQQLRINTMNIAATATRPFGRSLCVSYSQEKIRERAMLMNSKQQQQFDTQYPPNRGSTMGMRSGGSGLGIRSSGFSLLDGYLGVHSVNVNGNRIVRTRHNSSTSSSGNKNSASTAAAKGSAGVRGAGASSAVVDKYDGNMRGYMDSHMDDSSSAFAGISSVAVGINVRSNGSTAANAGASGQNVGGSRLPAPVGMSPSPASRGTFSYCLCAPMFSFCCDCARSCFLCFALYILSFFIFESR